jgi:lipopolysaccharide export system protein LptA
MHGFFNNKVIIKSLPALVRLSLLIAVLLFCFHAEAQTKTKKKIVIEEAGLLIYKQSFAQDVQRLLNNVKLSHQNMVMYCDSAWFYESTNSVDAFGKVHIISNDTVNMYSDFINYKGDDGIAKAIGNVKLKDPKLTLTTDTLDFDTKTETGYYESGGKIVDSTNVLTSIIGRYYSQKNELFFKDSVKLVNKDYVMTSDTMKYNTVNEIVTILGPTHIVGDSSYLYSEKGWFDTKNNISELLKNSTIRKGDSQLQGDYIYYEDNTGVGYAKGNVIINDFKNKIIIAGDDAKYNDFTQNALMTDSALFIQYYSSDSLFLHADTLFTKPDTSEVDQKLVICYNNVRFFKSDTQGQSDSLVYFTKDSTIQLFIEPVLWAENSQLSAEFIEMKNYAVPPNKVFLKENSFIIQEMDSLKYNQIKGKNMIGLINEYNSLYQINVSGNGQSIYYPEDNKDFIGVNKAESSNIVLYLKENKINRISFLTTPTGIMSPIKEGLDPETRLEGFKWRKNEKPTDKYDIFRNNGTKISPKSLPKTDINLILPSPENK